MDGSLILLFGRARALLLEAFCRAQDEGVALHLRELARRTGLSVSAVQYELGLLRQVDLIKDIGTASRPAYILNDGHLLHDDLRSMLARTYTGLLADDAHFARKRARQKKDRRNLPAANSAFVRKAK